MLNHIAVWNGSSWYQLGDNGLNDYVSDIAIAGTRIYAGGAFTSPNHIASYYTLQIFTHSWSSLGSGLNNYVSAIAVPGHVVYAGGNFTNAGGNTNADRIAQWGQWLYPDYLPIVIR